ncbi:3-octaprenyl-4-hydroxybenzoate decarboxylase, partial [Salmonella enterica subsp. enterica serovar Infantis]
MFTWVLWLRGGPKIEGKKLGFFVLLLFVKNMLFLGWLSHRGGGMDFQVCLAARPGEVFPFSFELGAD